MATTFDQSDDNVVVVIGSGAGGGTVAEQLAQKGVDVVCLEAGKRMDPTSDYVNDEWGMFGKTAWLDKRTTSGSWRVARDFPGLPAWIAKTVGGTTFHFAGASLRLQEHEFNTQSVYGNVDGTSIMDWPLELSDLQEYYPVGEDKMGVTRTHGIPPLPKNNNFIVMENGAKKIGYNKVHTGRMAINPPGNPRDGRAGCIECGFCFQGCVPQAKWSTLYSEIPKAEKTDHFELRTQAQVVRIEHDSQGKVNEVVYADKDGTLQRQKARAVCVACNSIESPRLLLNSESSMFPDGLANSSGEVGKNYTRHMTGSVYGIFDKPVNMYRGVTMAGIVEDEAPYQPRRGFAGGYHFETIALGVPFMAAFLNPGDWGEDFAELMEAYDRTAGMWIVGEDMSQGSNRVTVNTDIKDQYGMPTPNVHYDDHPNDLAMRNHAFERGAAIYEAVGATKVVKTPPYPSTHNLGTNRMSEDPDKGVVNKWGQSHDIDNLFVSDGSQFTTSAAENPTLTIVTLAVRQADYIADQMSKGNI